MSEMSLILGYNSSFQLLVDVNHRSPREGNWEAGDGVEVYALRSDLYMGECLVIDRFEGPLDALEHLLVPKLT